MEITLCLQERLLSVHCTVLSNIFVQSFSMSLQLSVMSSEIIYNLVFHDISQITFILNLLWLHPTDSRWSLSVPVLHWQYTSAANQPRNPMAQIKCGVSHIMDSTHIPTVGIALHLSNIMPINSTLQEKDFHLILNLAISLMANSLNFNSANYLMLKNFSMIYIYILI